MSATEMQIDPVAVLKQHNQWRRGDEDMPMQEPAIIGQAIDAAIQELIRLREVEQAALSVMQASDVRLIAALRHLFRVIRLQGKS